MGSGGIAPSFLSWTLVGGEWSASRPGRSAQGERAYGSNRVGLWVGLRAGLDALEKVKITFPSWELKPRLTYTNITAHEYEVDTRLILLHLSTLLSVIGERALTGR
jgi:hypothetical protein